MSRIGVTGATGFVGKATVQALSAAGHTVRALVRRLPEVPITGSTETAAVGEIGPDTEWSAALSGLDAVIHCAARAHVMQETAVDVEAAFRSVNTDGTTRLAEACGNSGVSRLVFVSSIKVNGEETLPGQPFTENDPPNPDDAYGRSKHAAEAALTDLASCSELDVVIIRPPLVYGLRAAGNLARLWDWIGLKRPLPLGLVNNKRDMIGLDNLADVLVLATTHPDAPGHTYVVRDGTPVSTSDLVRHMAAAQGVPSNLLPVPVWLLKLVGRLTGKTPTIQRLVGNLEINDSAIRRDLGWTPRLTMLQGFDRMAAHKCASPAQRSADP